MNSDVLILFVLDRSGSMQPVVADTINGVNTFLDEQREVLGSKAYLSMTLFDTSFDARFVAADLETVAPLGSKANPYTIGGMTALFDAVGSTIKGGEQWLINHPDFDGQVVVVVLTDGHENASRQWHVYHPAIDGDDKDLGGLIQWKSKEGWTFQFLGSGGSDWLERTFGAYVPADNIGGVVHDSYGTQAVYSSVSSNLRSARASGQTYAGVSTNALTEARNKLVDDEEEANKK